MRLAIFLFFIQMGLIGCTITGPGERGVRVSMGSAGSDVYEPGPHLWVPMFTRVHNVDVQVQKSDVHTSAASMDMQEITIDLAINWKLDPAKAVETFKNIGDEHDVYSRVIVPAVSEVLKAETAKHTAEEILKNRMKLKASVDEGLKARLSTYGISLYDVSIVHLNFTKGFEQAIEEKQIAEQKAKQASYEADKATQDAKAEVERAKGQAAAQNLVRASITREILQQRAIEKWDGHFPHVMSGNGALPFINMKME